MPNANNAAALYATQNQELTQTARHNLPAIIAAFGATITGPFLLVKRTRQKTSRKAEPATIKTII